jgi:hypothetical protein
MKHSKNKTDQEHVLTEFNQITPFITFTIKKEVHNKIIFSNLTIHWNYEELNFTTDRK